MQPLKRVVDLAEFLEMFYVLDYKRVLKKLFKKKDIKSIVGEKKGFYICTRLARKRVKKREKEVH